MTKRRRAWLVAASCIYAFGVWWMTLRPSIYDPEVGGILGRLLEAMQASPLTAWITFDIVESLSNVVMFVPLGLLVIAWRGRWWLGIVVGLVVSCAIELAQWCFLPTRVADPGDVVANTLGAVIGVVVGLLLRRRVSRSQDSHKARHRKLIDTRAQ